MDNLKNKVTEMEIIENNDYDDSVLLANFDNSDFKDNTLSKSDLDILNISALCCDEEIRGFDKQTGETWIYPTNYPVRDYQFNIIKAAIVKNTLVSLPTGLGKTFIAAVIMYNFYRWYPMGKIIFTAPTRPLVAQQIEACYNIVAIPPAETVEMTGHMQVTTRKTHWETKRVFFATPQVIYNDIKSGICQGDEIRCLVIDEAHRAKGNYAYCQIMSLLSDMKHTLFRVLALSATPGSKVDDVITIVKNLKIAHLELRSENCLDVAPYCHSRKINTVIVELGPELTKLRQQYVEILDVYARRLKELNILSHNIGNLSKGRIMMMYKDFQSRERGARHPEHNYIMRDFNYLITLYHGLELLVKHGTWVFLNFFDEHPEKTWILSDTRLTAFLENMRVEFGTNPLSLDISILPDGTIPDVPQNLLFGHPKFYKLKEIMLRHFNNAKQKGQETKAIVFCEYRESVNLVHCLLLQCRPLIVPQMFVGQGASGKEGKAAVSQKQQIRVMRSFRSGACNTLVCTCVAEEGLDVGSVDLIICFDVSNRSPVRLVQRCGRTGRDREGQVFILVTEGREHQILIDCMRQRDGLNQSIMRSKEIENNLYKNNARMIPRDMFPDCHKMFIKVAKKDNNEKSKKGQKDLRSMLLEKDSVKNVQNEWITKDEFDELFPTGFWDYNSFEKPKEYFAMSKQTLKTQNHDSILKLSSWLQHQKKLQMSVHIGHSADTQILLNVLQHSNKKKDLLPSVQTPTFNTQEFLTPDVFVSPTKTKPMKKQKPLLMKSPGKKDGDIRALFSTATKSTKSYSKLINEMGFHDGKIPTRFINLFVDINLENKSMIKSCWICLNVCDCKILNNFRYDKDITTSLLPIHREPFLPDLSFIDDFDRDSLLKYANKSADESIDIIMCDLNKTDIKDEIIDNLNTISKSPDKTITIEDKESKQVSLDVNFDIGDIDDIFADSSSSPEEAIEKEFTNNNNKLDLNEIVNTVVQLGGNRNDYKDSIEYFHLKSIDDLFEESDSDNLLDKNMKSGKTSPTTPVIEQNIVNNESIEPDRLSPSVLSGRYASSSKASTSPILNTQVRKFNLSMNRNIHNSTPRSAKKQLSMSESVEHSKSCNEQTSNDRSKSMLTITQTIEMINGCKRNREINKSNNNDYMNNTDDERSSSPILLTQRDKRIGIGCKVESDKHKKQAQSKQRDSLIILGSDSDSDFETNTSQSPKNYRNIKIKTSQKTKITTTKLKFLPDPDNSDSPYFNKKQKLADNRPKTKLTLQEKLLATLTSNKFNNDSFGDNDSQVNFMVQSPKSPILVFGKENRKSLSPKQVEDDKSVHKHLSMLQMFRCDNKSHDNPRKIFKDFTNTSTQVLRNKRKITFSDTSDDDFAAPDKQKNINGDVNKVLMNKRRNKKKKTNEFLDLEAELTDGSTSLSGDELSDESVGSIIDFICNDTYQDADDMHAHYLKSVKSPVKGVFKIPQLPVEFNKMEVLSQTVLDNDTYEMDSFCVDSHVGLTQVDEMSELERAEMILEEKRSRKKKYLPDSQGDDSPIARKKHKPIKRQIESDSDDSS